MFNGYRKAIIITGAAVLLTGGTLVTRVLADTPTPGPTATSTAARVNYGQVILGKLAAALGIDQSKLQSAIDQAASDTADQAVTNGDMTQQRADQLKSRIQQGGTNFLGGLGNFVRGHFGKGSASPQGAGPGMLNTGQTVVKAVADKLGVTVVDLQTQLKAGQTLSDIAKAKGVSDQDLRTAAVNALQPQLDAAVTAGKLTQQQEDSILQRIQQGQWPMLLGERMGGHQTRPQAPNPPQS